MANLSRDHHITHLALLWSFLSFNSFTLALSAAFVHEGQKRYYEYYYIYASGLIVAASVFSFIATSAFLVFNTYGDLYQGIKNSILVEFITFFVLFALHLPGAVALTVNNTWQVSRSSTASQLRKATIAFAWLSSITVVLLLVFLLTWALLHRTGRIETSILKSNIKEFLVHGQIVLQGSDVLQEGVHETGLSTRRYHAEGWLTLRDADTGRFVKKCPVDGSITLRDRGSTGSSVYLSGSDQAAEPKVVPEVPGTPTSQMRLLSDRCSANGT